jgi:ferredoxin
VAEVLRVEFTMCQDCWTCEEKFPGFRSIFGGVVLIDKETEDLAKLATEECPRKAISTRPLSQYYVGY